MIKWEVHVTKVANVGVHKMLRITCEIPQECGAKFIETMGWPTEEQPITAILELVKLATEDKSQRETPSHEMAKLDKPLEQTPPAGVHNPYSRRAGILANDKQFQTWLKVPSTALAADLIRHKCGVVSRKDILPGTDAALRFDLLQSAFVCWRDAPKHGAA
jgi:hypothetical protein